MSRRRSLSFWRRPPIQDLILQVDHMKHLNMLGLVAIATVALTTFLGSGSASATVLCKTELTQGCAANGWDYPVATVIESTVGEGESASIHTLGGTTLSTCTEAKI